MNISDFKFVLDEKVNIVLNTLMNAGFEAYIVGGCVRDLILGLEPNDFDITTNAMPHEVKSLFKRTVDTGIKHGTVTALLGKDAFEITTYRIDGEYKDGRHPENVSFTRNLADDLLRRDFTINAMAYNEKDGLVDIFGGLNDLDKGIIKGVSVADARFKEDALRMLRAIRFSARFGYDIEPKTKQAIKDNAKLIEKVSAERTKVELDKTLLSMHPSYFDMVYNFGLLEYISADLYEIFEDDENRNYLLKLLESTAPILPLRWTALLYFVNVKTAKKVLKTLKFDNATLKKILFLLEHKDEMVPKNELEIRRLMAKMNEFSLSFFMLKEAFAVCAKDESALKAINRARELYEITNKSGYATKIADLKIGGKELMELGYKDIQIGEKLAELLEMVLEKPELNEREYLLKNVKKMG